MTRANQITRATGAERGKACNLRHGCLTKRGKTRVVVRQVTKFRSSFESHSKSSTNVTVQDDIQSKIVL